MSLRNKLTILSITLMSLMTIPTLAENDNQPVNSRIENDNFDVQITTPEGWSETKDFSESIPETFTSNDQTFRGLQFKNGTELHGCAIFFTGDSWSWDEDEDDDDDADLLQTLSEVQELAFPGSVLSKITADGSFAADFKKETVKINLKGTIEGSILDENGDPTHLTIAGKIEADSTKGNFAIGSGTVFVERSTPIYCTTGVLFADDYKLIVTIWGTDEESQVKDAYRFLEAVSITRKAAVETVVVSTDDAVVVSEPVAVEANDTIVVTESTDEAVVVSEPVAVEANETVVITEPVTESTNDPVVVTESVVVTEVVQRAPETTEVQV